MTLAPLVSLKKIKLNNRVVIDKYTIVLMTYTGLSFSQHE